MQVDSSSNDLTKINAEDNDPSAGDLLRDERLRRGLNEEEIADQLNITKHYLKSLEANDYGRLPSAVFIKGYLKKYAELLELDPDKILSLYYKFLSPGVNIESKNIGFRKKIRLYIFKIFVSIICLLIFCGCILLYNYISGGSEPIEEAMIPLRPDMEVFGNNFSSDIAIIVENQRIDRFPLSMNYDLEEKLEYQIVASAEEGEEIRPETTRDNIKIVSNGSDFLRISFLGNSWIEVNDSFEKRIYRDIRLAGDILDIKGDAPFDIFFGDAPNIKVFFNGIEIDIAEKIRIDNSARLIVGS